MWKNVLICEKIAPEGIFDQKGLEILLFFTLISSLLFLYDNLNVYKKICVCTRNPHTRNAGQKGGSKFQDPRAGGPP